MPETLIKVDDAIYEMIFSNIMKEHGLENIEEITENMMYEAAATFVIEKKKCKGEKPSVKVSEVVVEVERYFGIMNWVNDIEEDVEFTFVGEGIEEYEEQL